MVKLYVRSAEELTALHSDKAHYLVINNSLKGFENFAVDWPILLVIFKLLSVSIFIIVTSPTSTHALMEAGWEEHNEPRIMEGRPNHLGEDSDQF